MGPPMGTSHLYEIYMTPASILTAGSRLTGIAWTITAVVEQPMVEWMHIIAGILAGGLLLYLLAALIRPEKF